MHFLIDLAIMILFFVTYKFKGIYTATAVIMACSLGQLIWHRFQKGRFEAKPLYTFLVITILGGATLFFQNVLFIQWKPTLIYWAFGLVLFTLPKFKKDPLVKSLLKQVIALSEAHWHQLNQLWMVFFTLMGALNLAVVYTCDTNTWVNFKLFGTLGITLIFFIAQGIWLSKISRISNDSSELSS